jgi:hypothetical protein
VEHSVAPGSMSKQPARASTSDGLKRRLGRMRESFCVLHRPTASGPGMKS